jgi:hypothetical protein
MYADSVESTVMRFYVMRIVNLKSFRTPKIGFTAMGIWTLQISVKMIAQLTLILIQSKAMAWRMWNAQSSGI